MHVVVVVHVLGVVCSQILITACLSHVSMEHVWTDLLDTLAGVRRGLLDRIVKQVCLENLLRVLTANDKSIYRRPLQWHPMKCLMFRKRDFSHSHMGSDSISPQDITIIIQLKVVTSLANKTWSILLATQFAATLLLAKGTKATFGIFSHLKIIAYQQLLPIPTHIIITTANGAFKPLRLLHDIHNSYTGCWFCCLAPQSSRHITQRENTIINHGIVWHLHPLTIHLLSSSWQKERKSRLCAWAKFHRPPFFTLHINRATHSSTSLSTHLMSHHLEWDMTWTSEVSEPTSVFRFQLILWTLFYRY